MVVKNIIFNADCIKMSETVKNAEKQSAKKEDESKEIRRNHLLIWDRLNKEKKERKKQMKYLNFTIICDPFSFSAKRVRIVCEYLTE